MKPLLLAINNNYIDKFLSWKGVNFVSAHGVVKPAGFDDYSHLLDVGLIFSSFQQDLIDRTSSIRMPFNFKIVRPWSVPTDTKSLSQLMTDRVQYYTDQSRKLNLFWSGGIDSTAMVCAFLQNCNNLDQLRIVYSPYSLVENQDFFVFLENNFPSIEKINAINDKYLFQWIDGINIKGHGSDDLTAGLDSRWIEKVGIETLYTPWRDFFIQAGANSRLIEFCENYFSNAGRPIDTVLEAKWWFHAANKSQFFIPKEHSFVSGYPGATLQDTSGFFDCADFESYTWHNIDQLIDGQQDFKFYKNFLKRYIYQVYKNQNYLKNYIKSSSKQSLFFIQKKIKLMDLHWIFKLDNNIDVRTKNLPLLSKKEFDQTYGNSLDYLFNF
jgi:hypothetical protein